jgi:signal transduction histidine kinase
MLIKLNFYLLLILVLSVPFQKTLSIQKDETKNILFLFSRDQGIVAYQMILNNFKNILREEYSKPHKLFIEYLDVGKFPDVSYQEYLFERFNEKYSDTDLDLLILVGPGIIPLIKAYASDKIKNLPTISMDFYNPFNKNAQYSLHPNTTEILPTIDANKNFNLAFSLFPDYSNIYVISGSTALDKFFNQIIINSAQKYQVSKHIVDLSDLTMDQLLHKVSQISEKSIVIVTAFTSDANNVSYSTPEAIRLISKKTSAPIFVLLDTPFDEGAFGGYVSSMQLAGIQAGKAAIKILDGQNPGTIRIAPDDLNRYEFDWNELKKRGLENSEFIPAGSIIRHKEQGFIESNKWLLSGVLIFVILQTLLIVNLVRLNRKQKLTTIKLQETENRFRELAREDRILRMGELTASLSHELNQPLTAIRNSAQAGLRFMKADKLDSATVEEILQNIVDDDKRAADVLSSIRQLLKLEKREKQKVDLNQLIKQVADIFKGELNKKNIQLHLNLAENPVYILGDITQIQQVLLNFISNAANAIGEANSIKKIIQVKETINNENVIISVLDYGTGIDESIKNNLFKPFVTTRDKGFGIGLAISKSIIDEHEGNIWAENNTEGGATFSFQLKLWNDGQSE